MTYRPHTDDLHTTHRPQHTDHTQMTYTPHTDDLQTTQTQSTRPTHDLQTSDDELKMAVQDDKVVTT